jgi:hypothetical protein
MAGHAKLNIALAISAAVVLVGSGLALAITASPRGDSSIIVVNGQEFAWAELGDEYGVVGFEANGVHYVGVRISDLVNDTGLDNPESYRYEVVSARDGYSKTVDWVDTLDGYLVLEFEKRAVFPSLTKSFWVETVGEINPLEVEVA